MIRSSINDQGNNIIGPINLDDWYYMRMLRESVNHAKSIDPIKYNLMIKAHSKFYNDALKEVVK